MNLSRLKPLVNNHEFWKVFEELITDEISLSTSLLEKQTDLIQIYRSQGQIESLKKLLKLRDRVNG